MNIPLHQTLAGVALASSLIFTVQAAEQPIPMPARAKFDANPSAEGSYTGTAVMQYGIARKNGKSVPIPERTVRITNNASYTVYPIMRAENSTLAKDGNGKDLLTGIYDPFDDVQREFRGFIGYEGDAKQGEEKKFYYGLKPGETIEVTLPIVFWNAGRMGIEAGGEYLLHDQTKLPNPLRMDQNALVSITKAKAGDTRGKGVVMWYKAVDKDMVAPADDSEDQLVEWTFRDHAFLTNPITAELSLHQIPDTQMLNLVNYDVSNVDSLYLPVAMQVVDGWMVDQIKGDATGKNWKPGSFPEKLGWTGAIDDEKKLQDAIRKFVAPGDKAKPNELLGQYFGGKGWPFYNFLTGDLNQMKKVKIPSGANLFPQSPLLNVRSNYADGKNWQLERYMLSSGGSEAVTVNVGAAGEQKDNRTNKLVIAKETPEEKIDFLVAIMKSDRKPRVEAHSAGPNPFGEKKNVTVTSFDKATRTVTFSDAFVNSPDSANFDIFRPVEDYAAEALIRLWYSWAEYYRKNWTKDHPHATTSPKTFEGTVDPYSGTLVLKDGKTAEELGLVEGMAVTADCLKDAQTEVDKHTGEAIILEIAQDKKTLILSQIVDSDKPVTDRFTFAPPAELQWTPKKKGDPGFPLFHDQMSFDLSKTEECRDPYKFAQQVYLVMASMNQIGRHNNNSVNKFMQDIIGANMGYIFDKKLHAKPEVQTTMAIIRDKIKSVLRGVTDFTEFPNTDDWYPAPREVARGYTAGQKQPFNVFNLDPYVWFIHNVLGFSGYGFSIDDDTADIGASGGTTLVVTVTGTKGLENVQQWTNQAPFGPVEAVCLQYSGGDPSQGDGLEFDVQNASNTSPIKITTSRSLLRTLKDGDKVVIAAVQGNTAANSPIDAKTKKPTPFVVANVGKNSFELMHENGSPTQGNGTFVKSGYWQIYPLLPFVDTATSASENELVKVFRRVAGDDPGGLFQGTLVEVNGNNYNPKTKEHFRVVALGKADHGRLLLNTPLTDEHGNPLPAQKNIKLRFFGEVGKAKK